MKFDSEGGDVMLYKMSDAMYDLLLRLWLQTHGMEADEIRKEVKDGCGSANNVQGS